VTLTNAHLVGILNVRYYVLDFIMFEKSIDIIYYVSVLIFFSLNCIFSICYFRGLLIQVNLFYISESVDEVKERKKILSRVDQQRTVLI
jgi:hypothetical protein